MAKFFVKKAFRDKFTNEHFPVKSVYEYEDKERITFLQNEGFLEKESPIKEIDVDEYHTGGGWYTLPNGEKVRGEDKALEALKALADSAE